MSLLHDFISVLSYRKVLVTLFALSFIVICCSEDNQPPSCTITAPVASAQYHVGDEILITANASDPDDGVTGVSFDANGESLGVLTSTPYNMTWNTTGRTPGNYTLRAVAKDKAGEEAVATVAITLPH